MDRATALGWIDRWDRQQEVGLPDREERFTALIDAVEAAAGRPDPLILDLGCGPGSLTTRLAARIPHATVIGIDADPVTLTLASAAYPDLTFKDVDMRVPGWTARLGLDRRADAAVSTTALHWLSENDLRACYATLATALRPGGILLNGDHFDLDVKKTPALARLEKAIREREDSRRFPDGHSESWQGWWEAIASDLPDETAERDRRRVEAGHHGSETAEYAVHVDALRAAGFAEVGTLWQRGDARLLCATLPNPAESR